MSDSNRASKGPQLATDWAVVEMRAADVQGCGIRLQRLARQAPLVDRAQRARIRLAIIAELRLMAKYATALEALDETVGEAMRVHRDMKDSADSGTSTRVGELHVELVASADVASREPSPSVQSVRACLACSGKGFVCTGIVADSSGEHSEHSEKSAEASANARSA